MLEAIVGRDPGWAKGPFVSGLMGLTIVRHYSTWFGGSVNGDE